MNMTLRLGKNPQAGPVLSAGTEEARIGLKQRHNALSVQSNDA